MISLLFFPLVVPKFLTQPSSTVRINLADTEVLECSGTGEPDFNITFYRHFDNGSSILIKEEINDVVMTKINNANYNDAGNYSCQMSNYVGANVSNFIIIVQGKPMTLL